MNRSQKILVSLSIAAAVGAIAYFISRREGTKRMLVQIADEGYETAQDVLFPGKRITERHVHYGPVIPR